MVVMPVSAASAGYGANNYVNFSGHNKRKNSGTAETKTMTSNIV